MWIDLEEEVAEMFSLRQGCLDLHNDPRGDGERSIWSYMHTGGPKDVGIRVRRVGRDPEKLEARRAYQRERMRRIRETDPSYGHKKPQPNEAA